MEVVAVEEKKIVPQKKEEKKPKQNFWSYVKRQYKKNRLAVYSLYFIYFIGFLALSADFIANEKPIAAKYQGEVFFPVLKQYAVDLGLSEWPKNLQNVAWKDLDFEWALWPVVPYLPNNLDFKNAHSVGPFDDQDVKSKRWRHWFGTDELGRDVLSGMLHGSRMALLVGIISMGIASFIGIFMGAIAGFLGDDRLIVSRARIILNCLALFIGLFYAFGVRSYVLSDAIGNSLSSFLAEFMISIAILVGILLIANILTIPFKYLPFLKTKVKVPADMLISRTIEIIVSIPHLFLIISIVAIAEPSIILVMAVIGFTSWTGIARFIRAELLKVRNLEYIEAANALGYKNIRILLKHAIPNSLSPVLIAIAFGIASAILVESTLSFLGIGVPADVVTWGSLLSLARSASQAWWLAIFPGFAIFITVTVFNLVGEGLSDALDPRKKR